MKYHNFVINTPSSFFDAFEVLSRVGDHYVDARRCHAVARIVGGADFSISNEKWFKEWYDYHNRVGLITEATRKELADLDYEVSRDRVQLILLGTWSSRRPPEVLDIIHNPKARAWGR